MNELISVLLPVYNGEKYLSEAIESILNQTYTNFEFIIIDDGSKDKSLEIINMYANIDNRIIVRSRENRGLIATLNEGIEISKGKYIARMDQDDISLPERLEIQTKYMIENKLDICGGNYIMIDQNSQFIMNSDIPITHDEILLTMASNVPFAHPTVMIRKDFLIDNNLKYGINGYRNAEDLDLWIKMWAEGSTFGNIQNKILKYRIVSNSMSRSNHKKIKIESSNAFNNFIIERKDEFEKVFSCIERRNLTNNMQQNLIKAIWRYFILYKNYKFLLLNFKRVKFYNFLRGTLSFLKYKVL